MKHSTQVAAPSASAVGEVLEPSHVPAEGTSIGQHDSHAPTESWLARHAAYLAVGDQGLLSMANFLATVLLARFCGAGELGIYSLGFTLMLLCVATQDALVVSGFTVFFHRLHEDQGEQDQYVRSTRWQQSRLASLLAAALLLVGCVLWLLPGFSSVGVCVLAVGVALPGILYREYVRREHYVRGRVQRALVLNAVVIALWLGTQLALAWWGMLTAPAAFLSLGVACLPALMLRHKFVSTARPTWAAAKRNVRFGSWLVASQMVVLAQHYLVYWILIFWQGSESTGVLAAAVGVVSLCNPIVFGLANQFGPKMSAEFARLGPQRLLQVTLRAAALVAGCMMLFVLLLAVAGDRLIALLFGGEFANQQALVMALAVATLLNAVRILLDLTVRTLDRTSASFKASMIGLGVNLLACIALVPMFNTLGAACALLLGNLAALATLLLIVTAAYRNFARGPRQEAARG